MLYYDRTDFSEGIDNNKASASTNFDSCHYWFSLSKGFKLQPYVCNRCQDNYRIW